jgi:hypothetical protein
MDTNINYSCEFEVLTAVIMKIYIFRFREQAGQESRMTQAANSMLYPEDGTIQQLVT